MTAGSPLMKVVLTPLAKSVLIPLGLSAGIAAAFAAIQKKNIYIYIRYKSTDNFKWRNRKYNGNS